MDELVMGELGRKPSANGPKGPSSPRNRLRGMLMRRRRQQSSWDLRLEEEQRSFGTSLRVFEPRPKDNMVMGGIFEVLEGKW